jgi:glycosyltransferase involved in cell wall biosynthesis
MFWLQLPGMKSMAIATVSYFTKLDIITRYPFVQQKLVVIPNGVDLEYKDADLRGFNTVKPRLLQVGTSHNKNLETVIEAVRDLSCTLVIVGELTKSQQESIRKHGIEMENHSHVDMPGLRKLYESADIVVFVSTHEGFGLPVIEAQALGKPVITSMMASLPEVAGNGSLFIQNAYNPREIREAIERIRDDENLRNELVARGYENVKRFDYDQMVNAYMKLYTQLNQK